MEWCVRFLPLQVYPGHTPVSPLISLQWYHHHHHRNTFRCCSSEISFSYSQLWHSVLGISWWMCYFAFTTTASGGMQIKGAIWEIGPRSTLECTAPQSLAINGTSCRGRVDCRVQSDNIASVLEPHSYLVMKPHELPQRQRNRHFPGIDSTLFCNKSVCSGPD